MASRDEIKAGIVIGISLLVLAGLILGVSGVSLWERYDQYTVRLRSTTGVDVGTPVRLGGLKVGKILRLAIPPDDTARVEITLGVRQGTLIPQGTLATVTTVGFLGDPFLQLSPEAHTTQRIPPGSRIPSREPIQIADLLQSLQGIAGTADTLLVEATAILKSDVRDLLRRVNEVAKATQGTIAHIDAFVSPANSKEVAKILAELDQMIQESAGSVRTLLENLTAASRRMDTTLGTAERTLGTAETILGENRDDIRDAVRFLKADLERAEGLIVTMEQTLHHVDRTLGHVDRTLLGNSDALEETMANLRRSTQNLREFTQALKERPWHVLFPPDRPEKPGLDSRPRAETRP
jgi:phospholipid/cholesterol/gamma-HCH transport system substrate-binding protein